MITLNTKTVELIKKEMESIPEKYQKPFNSTHEGYAVLLEEVRELEQVVFFGEKELKNNGIENKTITMVRQEYPEVNNGNIFNHIDKAHKARLREEAIQVAAMAARIIQELT